jgi:hypothetical protein
VPIDLQSELTKRNLRCLATVNEGPRATDHAVALSATRLVVVRRVERAATEDHTALATMISEGDFIWGALVYEQGEPPNSPGLIESFHVSQLDQLVARLIELREACGEAG